MPATSLRLNAAVTSPKLRHARAGSGGASGAEPRTLCTPFISDTIPLAEGILGTIEELLKNPGDPVDELEVIATVETDKVTLDIRATESGVIKDVLVEVGDEVKETQAIYTLENA